MPTYDFTCTACSSIFEASLPFGSKIKPICPTCGSKKTEKQITPPAIHFKGTGFFKTDNQKINHSATSLPYEKKPSEGVTEKKTEKPSSEPEKTSPAPAPSTPKTEKKSSPPNP